LKRYLPIVIALFAATTVFAAHPAPRSYPRMAYDAKNRETVMFGGESAFDAATSHTYDSDETWIWSGANWTQIFPVNHPTERTAHAMVYDSLRSRIVLFGGRHAKTTLEGDISLFNDTWVWNGTNWSQINTPSAPDPRQLFGMAYDAVRDRVVLYGGTRRAADGETLEAVYDTWEFDGTTWTKVLDTGEPKVGFPQLAFDLKRNQMILVGVDSTLATLMYAYDSAAHVWNKLTPEKLPGCVNDAVMTYRSAIDRIVLAGGVCSLATSVIDSTWEWNGANWTELNVVNPARATAQGIAYDIHRDAVVMFGGINAFDTVPRSSLNVFRDYSYQFPQDITRPSPRSLASFGTDTANNTAWLFGGLNEFGSAYIDDFENTAEPRRRIWGYKNGFWFPYWVLNGPTECVAPLSAYDTARSKLVVTCVGQDTFEFDGTAWTSFTPKNKPAARRFAAMVYDQNIKKVVIFGGFDGTNYRQDTWTWDGTDWTEVKKNRPPNRALMSMWYDPLQKKTIIYAGLGRGSIDERITRYSDMYSFDGTGWTKLSVSNTPGERFGAQIGVNPLTGKLLLFGGLRSQLDSGTNVRTQFYDNDTWIWDGGANTWTKLNPSAAPHARENGVMSWDPMRKELVLFGGYQGFYYSDTWVFDGTTWKPRFDAPLHHRAAKSPARDPVTPSGGE
jgi:hypothetical protein